MEKLDLSDERAVIKRMRRDHDFAHEVFNHFQAQNEEKIAQLPEESRAHARAAYNLAMTDFHASWVRGVEKTRAKYGSLQEDQDRCTCTNHWLIEEEKPDLLAQMNQLHLEEEANLLQTYKNMVKST